MTGPATLNVPPFRPYAGTAGRPALARFIGYIRKRAAVAWLNAFVMHPRADWPLLHRARFALARWLLAGIGYVPACRQCLDRVAHDADRCAWWAEHSGALNDGTPAAFRDDIGAPLARLTRRRVRHNFDALDDAAYCASTSREGCRASH